MIWQLAKAFLLKWIGGWWPEFMVCFGVLGMALVSIFFVPKDKRDKIFQVAGFIMSAILIFLGFKTKRGDS
jgi:hypothetical protein